MGILNIEPITLAGLRFMISLYGLSETGKTLTALKLMAGMEPDPRKRGLLDTEGGKRGKLYRDQIPGGCMYANLTRPFTPERYIQAVEEFEAAGMTVLTMDSISHAWFAEGGVLDMVDGDGQQGGDQRRKWIVPKRRLARMTGRILDSDMHIILCSRAKQPLVDGPVVNGKKTLVPGPVVPIQEKNLRYDMTIMAHMLGDGRYTITAPEGKCPGLLRDIFDGPVMNEDTGRRLLERLKTGEARSSEMRRLDATAREMAGRGSAAMREWWRGISKADQETLKPQVPNLQSIAAAADQEAAQRAEDAREDDMPDDPFAGTGDPISIMHSDDAQEPRTEAIGHQTPQDTSQAPNAHHGASEGPAKGMLDQGQEDGLLASAEMAAERGQLDDWMRRNGDKVRRMSDAGREMLASWGRQGGGQ